MERNIFDEIGAYTDDIADWQSTRFEREAKANSDAYPEFTQAAALLVEADRDLIQKLGGDEMETDDILHACHARGGALAIEMYKRGVLDDGRIYHAFLTHELPRKGDAE
jgi:hypothetical protein